MNFPCAEVRYSLDDERKAATGLSDPTERRNRRLIERAAEAIAGDLERRLSVRELAEQAEMSPTHFQRLFKKYVGESPSQYGKRLRLERSALELQRPGATVTEAAWGASYQAHEAFSRAFRSRFGLSPLDYRKEARARRRGETEPFEVVHLETTRLACVSAVGPYSDRVRAFEELRFWAEPLGLLEEQNLLALYWDDQEITAPERTRSDAAVAVPSELALGADISERWLPAGHYAHVAHVGPSSVRETYERVFRDWHPETGWRPDRRPMLVEYDERHDPWRASLFVAVTR